MSRQPAIDNAAVYFDSGEFQRILARRVACASESQEPDSAGALVASPATGRHSS